MVLRVSEKTSTLHVGIIVLENYVLMIPTVLVPYIIAAPGFVESDVPFVILIRNAAQVKRAAVSIFIIKVTALNLV